jgi:cyclic di-GMP phosphodiesterase
VLIADDNVDHLAFLRVAVGARYRVMTASNGAEAYDVACRVRPDAILLDLIMPVVDGFTVVRQLRANPATAETPIVFVTGLDADAVDAHAERASLSAVLRKPCHQGEILEAIGRVLRRG